MLHKPEQRWIGLDFVAGWAPRVNIPWSGHAGTGRGTELYELLCVRAVMHRVSSQIGVQVQIPRATRGDNSMDVETRAFEALPRYSEV